MEIWKDVKDFEGHYQVSNTGRVKTLSRTLIMSDGRRKTINERILAIRYCSNGYVKATLFKDSKKTEYLVHRLVSFHFINEEDGLKEINHIDGNKENNNVTNLEWSNRSLNLKHAFKNGLHKIVPVKGIDHKNSKLTEKDVREIRLTNNPRNISQIARKYKVSRVVIYSVLKGTLWSHVK